MAGEAIFIGYRRDDTADVAGRIYDAMALRFGKTRIFKDVDNIGPGVDFGDYIKSVLPRCRVALVLIGPHWLDSKDGARMPRGEEVPESLRPLLRRNAAIIRRDPDFHDDVERLAAALRASVNTGILDLSKISGKASAPAPRARASRTPLIAGGAIMAAVAVAAVLVFAPRWFPPPPAGEVDRAQRETEGGAVSSSPVSLLPDSSPESANRVNDGQQSASAPPPARQSRQTAESTQGPVTLAPVNRPAQRTPVVNAFRDCPDVCPEMVRIPGGTFTMGSPANESWRGSDENQRTITVAAFAAGRFEVTRRQWATFVRDTDRVAPQRTENTFCTWGGPSTFSQEDTHAVACVNRDDARAYSAWLSQRTGQHYRLLIEAEWEYAARAGTTTRFYWGDQDPVCDQNARNGALFLACDGRARSVGSFLPNGFGLYDMYGNLAEWVQDCYANPYPSAPVNGTAYERSGCSQRALRGGSAASVALDLGSARRAHASYTTRYSSYGFRVARTL